MRKISGVQVVDGGNVVATVELLPEGHVRRGTSKRPLKWAISHTEFQAGLQWKATLSEVIAFLTGKYPNAKRRLVFATIPVKAAA